MTWVDSSGTRGRCDSKCQKAKGSVCKCICSGRFHGSARQPGGVEKAVRNFWDDVIDEAEKTPGLKLETERWQKNRQRILGELPTKAKPVNTEIAIQGRLPLEVASA